MTPFRARIREIAEDTAVGEVTATNVEIAILRAIEELLTAEPSEEMIDATKCGLVNFPVFAWKAMSNQLLREVKGEPKVES